MLPEQRKRNIVRLVTERGGCSVAELAEHENVSEATVRRDLRELTDEGLVERSHGGAVPVTNVGREQSYDQREVQNLAAKTAIAERAVEEIHEGQVVFFDSGTTTVQVAKAAPSDGSFLPAANSPLLALELETTDTEVKVTGGSLRHRTKALVGPTAEAFMDRMSFDLLFLGTNGIDTEGLTTPDEDEARMKELMIERSERVVLVTDSTKFGERALVQFGELADVDLLVTDAEPTAPLATALGRANVRTAVVEGE